MTKTSIFFIDLNFIPGTPECNFVRTQHLYEFSDQYIEIPHGIHQELKNNNIIFNSVH